DTWERHLLVPALVRDARSVLDVGGLPGQLDAFLPGAKVLAANISEPADLLVDPAELPVRDAVRAVRPAPPAVPRRVLRRGDEPRRARARPGPGSRPLRRRAAAGLGRA